MKKVILIVSLMLAPFLFANFAEARPNNQNTQVAQQKVKKKKQVKKKPVKKVQQVRAQAQRPQVVVNQPVVDNEESTAQYWARENERQRVQQEQVASSLGVKRKNNNLISKTPLEVSKQVSRRAYAEAKRWEGKHASMHRVELKTLMAAGNNNQPVDPVRIPWCAGFVNAMLARSGYETSGSLRARSFLHYGIVTKNPEIGDIVVTTRGRNQMAGHVGFFEGYEWIDGVKYIKVYGGNTAKSVQVGYFHANKVLGYRRPVIA